MRYRVTYTPTIRRGFARALGEPEVIGRCATLGEAQRIAETKDAELNGWTASRYWKPSPPGTWVLMRGARYLRIAVTDLHAIPRPRPGT